jgi:hypothetical protein
MDDNSDPSPIKTSAAEPAYVNDEVTKAKEVRKWDVWTLAIVGGCVVADYRFVDLVEITATSGRRVSCSPLPASPQST